LVVVVQVVINQTQVFVQEVLEAVVLVEMSISEVV